MPKSAQFRVVWSPEQTSYLLSETGNVEVGSLPEDAVAWLHWLHEHSAFAFDGRDGHLNLLKERRRRGIDGYWYAYLRHQGHMIKRYVGRSEQVTMEYLEALARQLIAESCATPEAISVSQSVKTVSSPCVDQHNGLLEPPLQFEPLLMTKLQLPRLQSSLLPRENLLDLLDKGLERKLTLVAGPAGYGKTTLVGQWIATRTKRSEALHIAYITLDERDNDPLRFWRYFIAACQALQPGFGREALELLLAHRLPPFKPLEMMLTVLLNELSQLEQPGVLVLDDFHVLEPSVVTETLSFVLEHLPTAFHLVILIRGDPPFSLTRLRARNELLDIYPPYLAFTPEETNEFLTQELTCTLAPGTLRQISERIAGWPTGLRLLAKAINEPGYGRDVESLLSAFAGSHWSVQDYFLKEVLNSLPPSLQAFLLQTSTLPLISVALCDAIMDCTDSQQQLNVLHGGDLFLISLEGGGEWSFYQTLFAEAMLPEARRRFGAVWLRQLAMRASAWYEQHGLLAEAIVTALNSAEWKRSSSLIMRFFEDKQRDKIPTVPEWYTLNRWMGRLPEDELERNPDLCLQYAMSVLFIQMESEGASVGGERVYHLLQLAEQTWRDANDTAKLAEVFAFRALLARQEGRMFQAVTWANQSLAWLPADNLTWRNLSLTVVGVDELLNGDLNTAQGLLLEALGISERQGNGIYARATRAMLSWLNFERGELHRTAEQFRQMQAEAREQKDRDDVARTQLGLAQITYQWNNLSESEMSVREALTIAEQMNVEDVHAHSLTILAQIEAARGQTVQAQHLLLTWLARAQTPQTPHSYQILREVQLVLAHLQLASGDFSAVERWFTSIEHDDKHLPLLQSQRERLLYLRFLLTQSPIETATIITELEDLLATALRTGHVYFGLEVQIVLVLAYAWGGSDVRAHEQLRELLQVTRNDGYLRIFLDAGIELHRLLRGLLSQLREKALLTYARHIVSAFALDGDMQIQDQRQPVTVQLPEPLSQQERKVLRLLVAGNSNAEIARELIVSVNTIRTQLQSIYRKLNVNNRVEASAVANQLGLFA